jgi:hypothetical protein
MYKIQRTHSDAVTFAADTDEAATIYAVRTVQVLRSCGAKLIDPTGRTLGIIRQHVTIHADLTTTSTVSVD